MFEHCNIQSQPRAASLIHKLGKSPPNCLLVEGGSADERQSVALYWAMSLNCTESSGPCLNCRTCKQISQNECRDLKLFKSGKELTIDEVRQLRPVFTQKPHNAWRVIIIPECQGIRSEPANALLKSLEEPCPGNSFVLLTPQRENLFPTLVSRSFVLTLSRSASNIPEDTDVLFNELIQFTRTGKGWLDRTMSKDSVSSQMAHFLIARCRQEMINSMLYEKPDNPFTSLNSPVRYQMIQVLKKAEHSLHYTTKVDLVMEWMAVSLWKKFLKAKAGFSRNPT
ncbi:hypothetical protein [Desulfonatronovibrio magnus]|uniref:hypothetical protein n=1 Tax=Desulfonatronovibrio magnus TaxID=698827 RepID=UPI000698E3FE|nr:hypothetical protein [Desulfonatronovibrio magnus]